ncbi:hypothetical protein FKM82_016945 [Ascaphus truei]
MDWEQLDVNPKVVAAVKKANIKSATDILTFSGPDLQRMTKLSSPDVHHLQNVVSAVLRKGSGTTALQMCREKGLFPSQHHKLSLGCRVLDKLLRGAVYICTEDAFPSKRLQQLINLQHKLRSDVPFDVIKKIRFGDNIFIEHAADIDMLNECITKKVPILLLRGSVRLIVIDSIAALFRCEFAASDSVLRAKHLQTFGAKLHSLSSRFLTPVLCINQVTDAVRKVDCIQSNFGQVDKTVSPALGISWSNQLLVRVMVARTQATAPQACAGSVLRTMEVISAPHIPRSVCYYTVHLEGVKGIDENVQS